VNINVIAIKPPTQQEAYAIHAQSNFYDAVNNHIGILNSVIDRLDKTIEDSVHGNLADLLQSEIDDLVKKRERVHRDTIQYVGGEERYKELILTEIWASVSMMRTWMNGEPCDVDGELVDVQAELNKRATDGKD
jgi:archaellum component FlaC